MHTGAAAAPSQSLAAAVLPGRTFDGGDTRCAGHGLRVQVTVAGPNLRETDVRAPDTLTRLCLGRTTSFDCSTARRLRAGRACRCENFQLLKQDFSFDWAGWSWRA